MFNNTSEKIDIIPSKYYPETKWLNNFKFRQIKTVLFGALTISVIQGIDASKTLAFDIIPIEAVSTSVTSFEYFGWEQTPEAYNVFQVEVNNYPGLNPMAKLLGFTVSVFVDAAPYEANPEVLTWETPLGWQLNEIVHVPYNLTSLTYQATNPNAGILPGQSLGGFGTYFRYNCGIYCRGPAQFSVIAVSSSPVPEPVTIFGSAIALGFGISLKRKLAKPNSKQDLKTIS